MFIGDKEIPFEIGGTYFVPRRRQEQRVVVCPVCCGHKYVWFRNIEGTEFQVVCSECAPGLEAPRGSVYEYTYEAGADQVVLTGISSIYNDRVSFTATVRGIVSAEDLYVDHAEALAVSQREIERCIESNMRMSEFRTHEARKKASWSASYHQKLINDHQKKIDWHQARLNGTRYKLVKGKYVVGE
jgi:hypothetical protein